MFNGIRVSKWQICPFWVNFPFISISADKLAQSSNICMVMTYASLDVTMMPCKLTRSHILCYRASKEQRIFMCCYCYLLIWSTYNVVQNMQSIRIGLLCEGFYLTVMSVPLCWRNHLDITLTGRAWQPWNELDIVSPPWSCTVWTHYLCQMTPPSVSLCVLHSGCPQIKK